MNDREKLIAIRDDLNVYLTPQPVPAPSLVLSPGFWSARLADNAVLNPNSPAMIADLVRQSKMQPLPNVNTKPWTMPFYLTNNSMPIVSVAITDAGNNQASIKALFAQGIHMPVGAKVGEANTDRKIQFLNTDTDTYYELQWASVTNGVWTANNGCVITGFSKSNGQNPWVTGSNYNSCTATWLPIVPGLIKLDEVKSGIPTHALCMAIAEPSNLYVYPAKQSDGMTGKVIPEGAHLRLPAGFPINPSDALLKQFIIKTLSMFGGYIIDKCPGGSANIYCEDTKDDTIGWTPYKGGLMDYQIGESLPWGSMEIVV